MNICWSLVREEGTVVCCFSRYEWVDKETLPSRAPAEKIDRSLRSWLRTSTE